MIRKRLHEPGCGRKMTGAQTEFCGGFADDYRGKRSVVMGLSRLTWQKAGRKIYVIVGDEE